MRILMLPFLADVSPNWPVIRVVCVSYTSSVKAWLTGKLIRESPAEKVKEEGGRRGTIFSSLLQASIIPPRQIMDISSRLSFIKLALAGVASTGDHSTGQPDGCNFQAKNGFANPLIFI